MARYSIFIYLFILRNVILILYQGHIQIKSDNKDIHNIQNQFQINDVLLNVLIIKEENISLFLQKY